MSNNKVKVIGEVPKSSIVYLLKPHKKQKKYNMSKIEFYISNKGIVFERDLINSKAYMSLKGKSAQVYGIIMCRRKFDRQKHKIRGKSILTFTNNGKIKLTYAEMKRKYNISNYQFSRIIDDLCERGFINAEPFFNEMIQRYEINFTLLHNYKDYGNDKFKPGKRQKSLTFFNKDKQKRDSRGRFIRI